MAYILQITFFNAFIFYDKNACLMILILLNFVSKCAVDDKLSYVQVMAWCRTGDKPLIEPITTKFDDIVWHQRATMNRTHQI